jgi:tetratricopeptide (TPR) repeat protein
VEATPLPPTVEPVVVEGSTDGLDWSVDGEDAAAASAEGREAALRYMRTEAPPPVPASATADADPRRVTGPRAVAGASPREPEVAGSAREALPRTQQPAAARTVDTRTAAEDPPARRVADPSVAPDSGDARSLNARAIGLINAGRPDQAIPLLERAVALQPRDAEMLGNLGYAHMLAGEHRRARDRLRTALDIAPTRSATWLNLGQTYAGLGQRDVAVDAVVTGHRYSTRKASVRSALQRAATGDRHSAAWREAAALALSRIG